eukprot:m.310087 g.310087  ORF g.310087 m.310087 type:complete len:347 (+) comp49452_c0_seq1:61-1101(+)
MIILSFAPVLFGFLLFSASAHGLAPPLSGQGRPKEMTAAQRQEARKLLGSYRARLEATEVLQQRCIELRQQSMPYYGDLENKCSSEGFNETNKLRIACTVLEGALLVDTRMHEGDPEVNLKKLDRRKKRSSAAATKQVERKLDTLSVSLKSMMAEEAEHKLLHNPTRRYRRRSSCNIQPRSDHSTRAVRAGKTIETSVGGSVGVVITSTNSDGYVYGQNGEFGCITTQCYGLESDAGVAFGVAEGYYDHFDDVAGTSKIYMGSVGGQSGAYSFGVIYSQETREKIGYVSSFEAAADFVPVSVGLFYCKTEMVRGRSCTVTSDTQTVASRSWGRLVFRKQPVKTSIC